jgi:diacylglycerol kinase (ATP)
MAAEQTSPEHAPAPAAPPCARIALLVNVASGRGRAKAIAARLAPLCGGGKGGTGGAPRIVEVGPGRTVDLDSALAGCDVVIIVGGDGTLHRALPALRASGATVYHAPTGTENLFAREFGMSVKAAGPAASLASAHARPIDLGECDLGSGAAHLFVLMASIGLDAAITHRLAARRTGPIRRSSYLAPIVTEAIFGRPPVVSIEIDGARVVTQQRGLFVCANSRHYAVRLNPARDALIDDGLLDFVFFPARGPVTLTAWAALARVRLHVGRPGVMYRQAKRARVTIHDVGDGTGDAASPSCPWLQLDGEPIEWRPQQRDATIEFRALPGALNVAAPPAPPTTSRPSR